MTAKIYLYKLDKEYILREGLGNTGLLPKCRIEKMVKYKNEEAKYQSFAAGRLLVMILSAESGMNQEDIIEILDSDKHSVDGRTVELPSGKLIHYNISHSGKIVTVATSEESIGIDVEGKDVVVQGDKLDANLKERYLLSFGKKILLVGPTNLDGLTIDKE